MHAERIIASYSHVMLKRLKKKFYDKILHICEVAFAQYLKINVLSCISSIIHNLMPFNVKISLSYHFLLSVSQLCKIKIEPVEKF